MWELFLTFISHICINCVQHLLMSDLHPTRPQQYRGEGAPAPDINGLTRLTGLIELGTMAVKIFAVCLWYFNSARPASHSLQLFLVSCHLPDRGATTPGVEAQTYSKSSRLSYALNGPTVQIYSNKFDHQLQVYLQAYFIFIYHPTAPHKETLAALQLLRTRELLCCLNEITWHSLMWSL